MEQDHSDYSDSQSEEVNELADYEKVNQLINSINENPYDMPLYLQLIDVYRAQGNLD